MSKNKIGKQNEFIERLRKSSFPPAAVMGAFASFFATAFGHPTASRKESPQSVPLVQIGLSESGRVSAPMRYDREYRLTLVLGAANSPYPFRRSLSGIAIGAEDQIFALGDDEVRIFGPDGKMIRNWKAPAGALCLAVEAKDRIYFGLPGRVEFYTASGTREGGFAAVEDNRPARITAIRISGQEILIADAESRLIRRYSREGRHLGAIGAHGKTRGFMLPNRSLDIDVDAKGVIRATDPGRHRVASWEADGLPGGHFGKFGLTNPEDFVGCCNPVNLAIAPDGNIVTAEKVAARVKVYSPDGRLLALIGPENFDPKCVHFHLAVDSRGRIFVADPVRLEVKVFSLLIRTEKSKNV
jgi:hypothetical protein